MRHARRPALLAALLLLAACQSVRSGPVAQAPRPAATPEIDALYRARQDSAKHRFGPADARFMTGMIGHHAQALVMAGWAPGNGASPAVRTLASRIINAQRDEIALMQGWLRDRDQPVPAVPAPGDTGMQHDMAGMNHDMAGMNHDMGSMRMPGMLTDAQLAQLKAARGPDFDRLFLTFMIQHHKGAVTMVNELFRTDGAGQDELVFKFASDVQVDQSTEIARMERMLALLPPR